MSTFDDLDTFVATRRQAGLALSPDGSRLVTTVAELSSDATRYVTSIWQVDPRGEEAARRLTRSSKGESSAAFAPDGDLFFTSGRPDPSTEAGDDEPAALWVLPAHGGESRQVLTAGDGVAGFQVARDSGHVVVATTVPVGDVPPTDEDEDPAAALRAARKKAGVSARLHIRYPVRFWDHDLGPGRPQIRIHEPLAADRLAPAAVVIDPLEPGHRLREHAISPDGRTLAVAVDVRDPEDPAAVRVRLELRRGPESEVVADEPGVDHEQPSITPDGRWLLWIRERHAQPGRAPAHTLLARRLDGGDTTTVLPEGRLTLQSVVGSADPDVVHVTADEQGHAPVFRVAITTGEITRLTRSGACTDVVVTPEGGALYALRSAPDAPPTPVRLDPYAADQDPTSLRGATEIDPLPGTLTEVTTTGEDGAPLRAWLALPEGDGPHPLLVWIHGGPFGSWNAWTWRWNPWTATARGYAVLLPDPRLSTGYGQEFMDVSTGAWGGLPYTDLMALTDACVALPEIDEGRTAAMGGSFGGYMANWVAGHTDRFDAIVTHASIWHLDGFVGTTDGSYHWTRQWGDPIADRERYDEHSPHRFASAITTPMLVIHGDKDYRVPIGEGLRLWYDLQRHGVESQFLYFPDENHWVLRPGDVTVWYSTVFAFLAHHVLGEDWTRPDLV
ncbi:S9 family peptidase [Actinomycetospora termitidis]|uniref:S9 family peptidase n=1 Tax=Actinomycetospora termitidis TaxID=3053470 RepID=A0ABT7M5S6_9PSEU|nr:S9 family peptidase [Actinomycetospora sp. Odt1-22]MDL5156004.1 S9 family peptidase [Actinomycetospora sp. Odt1-22]